MTETSDSNDERLILRRLLEVPDADTSEILRLATAIATADERYVRFTVDAGHISRLGLELVTRKETALSELIKNSYDADATRVILAFDRPVTFGAGCADTASSTLNGPDVRDSSDISDERSRRWNRLRITDDGTGMTRHELVDGFMRLSTPSKLQQPRSPRGRERAGSKGIGRFAAQRLGHQLTIGTRASNELSGLRVVINWDHFTANNSLESVTNPIATTKQLPGGTELSIEELRDTWDEAAVSELVRYVAPLVQPFKLSRPVDATIEAEDDFAVIIQREGLPDIDVRDAVYSVVEDSALARIDGHIDPGGRGVIQVTSKLLGLNESLIVRPDDQRAFPSLDGARFVAFYFILQGGYLPAGAGATIRQTLRRQSGIRVYRNGFRVVPYGERGNDWLGLDEYYGRRSGLLDPIANSNFLGFVELQDPSGERFQETSSREGLLENEATRELRQFVFSSLLRAVERVSGAKSRLGVQKPKTDREIRARLDRVMNSLKALRDTPSEGQGGILDDLGREVRGLRRDFVRHNRQQVEEISMLRVLATLGITVSSFIHEVGQTLAFIESAVTDLIEERASNREQTLMHLRSSLDLLRGYTTYFQSALRDNAERYLHPQEMHDVINAFRVLAEPLCAERGITLNARAIGFRLYTRPMHGSEWSAILLNLLSNAVKAIRRTNRRGMIDVVAWNEGPSIVLEFSDDGDGINANIRDRIFDPFFSTATSHERGELSGMGLGLKIVKDVVESNKGSIDLVNAPSRFRTCFRVSLPAATSTDIEHLQ